MLPDIKHIVRIRWEAFKKAVRLKPFGQGIGALQL
tara:strand:+ start:1027 stop:1131 length:105 start_codon:yes stop_codon:yes gene_type:complete